MYGSLQTAGSWLTTGRGGAPSPIRLFPLSPRQLYRENSYLGIFAEACPLLTPDAFSPSLSLDKFLSFQQSLPHGHLPCVVTQGPSLKGPHLG